MERTVLITGGSSGIGYELSKHFAKDGYRLLWVALTEEELVQAAARFRKEAPDTDLYVLALDLSKESASGVLLDWIDENQWSVDVLVNNAGFGNAGCFETIAWERERAMLQVNMIVVYTLTRLFLQRMDKRGSGKIMNISSVASYYEMPYAGGYAGSKAFVRHFTSSLQLELKHRKSPVQLTIVCPGPIKETNFRKNAGMEGVRTFDNFWSATTVREVALDAYRGLRRGRQLVVSGQKMRFSLLLNRILPRFIRERILLYETTGGQASKPTWKTTKRTSTSSSVSDSL